MIAVGASFAARRRRAEVVWVRRAAILPAVIWWGVVQSASAEVSGSDTVELHFGQTKLVLESKYLGAVNGVSKSSLMGKRVFDVANDTTVRVILPPSVNAVSGPPCGGTTSVLLTEGAISPRAKNPIFDGATPRKTELTGLSVLAPIRGLSDTTVYQFDSDDLKDYRGDQLVLFVSPPFVRFRAQITGDLWSDLGSNANCFLPGSEAFAIRMLKFIRDRIKSGR
ncbi:MAG: hypothetical protein AB1586_21460 [Pseudomonadota bacterium]|jgi:hypothetical protein